MTEIKHPNLSDEQLIELLQCVRVINYKNYPDHFKDVDTPLGHELIDTVIQRLRAKPASGINDQATVDLNTLFHTNYDLETYIFNTARRFYVERQAQDLARDVMVTIHRDKLVMRESTAKMTLHIIVGDTRTLGVPASGHVITSDLGGWGITVIPHDAV